MTKINIDAKYLGRLMDVVLEKLNKAAVDYGGLLQEAAQKWAELEALKSEYDDLTKQQLDLGLEVLLNTPLPSSAAPEPPNYSGEAIIGNSRFVENKLSTSEYELNKQELLHRGHKLSIKLVKIILSAGHPITAQEIYDAYNSTVEVAEELIERYNVEQWLSRNKRLGRLSEFKNKNAKGKYWHIKGWDKVTSNPKFIVK